MVLVVPLARVEVVAVALAILFEIGNFRGFFHGYFPRNRFHRLLFDVIAQEKFAWIVCLSSMRKMPMNNGINEGNNEFRNYRRNYWIKARTWRHGCSFPRHCKTTWVRRNSPCHLSRAQQFRLNHPKYEETRLMRLNGFNIHCANGGTTGIRVRGGNVKLRWNRMTIQSFWDEYQLHISLYQ